MIRFLIGEKAFLSQVLYQVEVPIQELSYCDGLYFDPKSMICAGIKSKSVIEIKGGCSVSNTNYSGGKREIFSCEFARIDFNILKVLIL